MKVGLGKAELTPPLGVELTGYGYYLNRRAQSVLDRLYARALYITADNAALMLISCDMLGLSRAIADAVFEHLQVKYGLDRAQVMLVSIHTHTGASVKYHEGCGAVSPAYEKTVAPAICQACDAAMTDASDISGLSMVEHPIWGDYAYNRSNPDGPVDHLVRGLLFERPGRRPIALVSYACHAVSRGRITGISADYPGQVNHLLDERGFDSLYINGLCGDIDPFVPENADRDDRLNDFAAAICDAFLAERRSCPQTLRVLEIPFTLRLSPVTREAIRQAADQAVVKNGGEEAGGAKVARIWEKEMLAQFNTLPKEEALSLRCARIGHMWVAALPFEGFTQTGMVLRACLPGQPVIVLGCAEELLGYLPTRDDIARGAYAALESTFLYKRLPIAPGEAERLGEALGQRLKEEMKP